MPAEVSAEKQRRSQENVRGLGKNSKNASLASHKLNANGGLCMCVCVGACVEDWSRKILLLETG